MKVSLLQTDLQLSHLLPLICDFCVETGESLQECLQDVLDSLKGDGTWTLVVEEEEGGEMVAYLTGHFKTKEEFYITQIFSSSPPVSPLLHETLEEAVKQVGGKSILGKTRHDVRVFEKYGYTLSEYVMKKEV
jgi:hypothetical protein